jgi:hypothetical protein
MPSFLKKPTADIALNISDGPFYPGSAINVGILISSQDSFPVRSGSAELACVESYWVMVSDGKTQRQQKKKRKLFESKEEFLGSTEFMWGMALNKSASFTLPADLPPTVCGKVVNIRYQLDVKLDVAKMRDIHKKCEITTLPIPTGTPDLEGSIHNLSSKVTTSSDEGELTLSLDSEHGAASETLHGSLEAMMKQDVSVREIRVELEVKESAGSISSKTIADAVMLEQQTSLARGSYRKWQFELKLPDAPLPNISTDKSSVVWLAKGIMDKGWKKDFSVTYPIQIVLR